MNKRIYAILDIKALDYGPLMVFRHDAPAIRTYNDLAHDDKTQIGQHPEDFDLVCLGELTEPTEDKPVPRIQPLLRYEDILIINGAQWKATRDADRARGPKLASGE